MTADDSLRLTGGTSGNIDDSVITPRLCRSRYQIKNELMFTVMRCALRSLRSEPRSTFALQIGNEEQRSELSPSLVEADKRRRRRSVER